MRAQSRSRAQRPLPLELVALARNEDPREMPDESELNSLPDEGGVELVESAPCVHWR